MHISHKEMKHKKCIFLKSVDFKKKKKKQEIQVLVNVNLIFKVITRAHLINGLGLTVTENFLDLTPFS